MSTSSPTRRGLGTVRSAALLAWLTVSEPIRRLLRTGTSFFTITGGSPTLASPSVPYDELSAWRLPPLPESGSASTQTTPPPSSTKSQKRFDAAEWEDHLKRTYGIANAQDMEDLEDDYVTITFGSLERY